MSDQTLYRDIFPFYKNEYLKIIQKFTHNLHINKLEIYRSITLPNNIKDFESIIKEFDEYEHGIGEYWTYDEKQAISYSSIVDVDKSVICYFTEKTRRVIVSFSSVEDFI